MTRKFSSLVAAVVLAAIPAGSTAQAPPPPDGCFRTAAAGPGTSAVYVIVNGECRSFNDLIQYSGKLSILPTQTVDLGNGASFTLSAAFDADPASTFTFGSVLPVGFGPFTFDAYFVTGVVGGPYNHASSSGTLGVTANGAVGATGLVTAGLYPAYISGYGDAANLGVDTGIGPCTISAVPSPPQSISCDPPGASNSFAPMTPSFLTARLSYTHATPAAGPGSVSTVGWTGGVFLDATAVPEPGTVSLVVSGLLVLGVVARRRRV
jgi:hypothetical protein